MEDFIGEGAHWKVYLVNSEITINRTTYKNYIKKKSKREGKLITDNVQKYEAVRQADLPTLAFFRVSDDNQSIIAEHLNTNNTTFVSPNTARYFSNKKNIILYALKGKDLPKTSKSEDYFTKNKLKVISNFEDLTIDLKKTAKKASMAKLELCEDAFFFGITQKQGGSFLTHKIADFDCIEQTEEFCDNELEKANIRTALNSLWEFVECFVEKNASSDTYKTKIENEISSKCDN